MQVHLPEPRDKPGRVFRAKIVKRGEKLLDTRFQRQSLGLKHQDCITLI